MTANTLISTAETYLEEKLSPLQAGYESNQASDQTLWHVLDLAVFVISPGGVILASNPAAKLVFGDHENMASPGSFSSFFPAGQHEALQQALALALQNQVAIYCGTMLSREQVSLPVEMVIKSSQWKQKKALFCFCRDQRARSELEEQVDLLQRQLEEMLDTSLAFQYHLLTDPNGKIALQGLSPSASNVIGYSQEQMFARHRDWLGIVHPEDCDFVAGQIRQRVMGRQREAMEYRILQPDGNVRWVEDSLENRRIQAGRVLLAGMVTDITDRKRAEEIREQTSDQLMQWVNELKQRNSEAVLLNEMGDLLQSSLDIDELMMVVRRFAVELFSGQSGALYLLDSRLNLLESALTWGDCAPSLRDFPPEDCWGLRRNRVVPGNGSSDVVCKHVSSEHCPSYLCVPMTVQTETIGLLHLCSQSREPLEHLTQLALMFASRVALALSNLRLSETLRQQSIRDPLTGLFNRRYLEEMLAQELRRSIRHKRPIGLIMADVDHFKDFNDQYGHAAGDLVLKEVSHFFQEQIRGEDIICRYGGEEFIVVLVEASLKDTEKRANLLRQGIEALTIHYGDVALGSVTLSFGVAAFPQHGDTCETLIESADNALYRAKHAGRNCVISAE